MFNRLCNKFKPKRHEQTIVMLKPHPEKQTNKSQEYFQEVTRRYARMVGLVVENSFDKNFTKKEAELHYRHLRLLSFFPKIVDYIMSGNNHIMLISGENAIEKMDKFKDKLRKKYHCHPSITSWMHNDKPYRNIIHTSDSRQEAEREVERYFWKNKKQ